eukprot:gene12596-15822_t
MHASLKLSGVLNAWSRAAATTTSASRILFSDIDGTIVHAPSSQDRDAVLITPPCVSGRHGEISSTTFHKVAKLRSQGVHFCVITGARLSTLLMRLAFLPAADAFVCENGGRIFYPGSELPTACQVTEDLAWRDGHESAGPANQDCVPPEEREGTLWTWYKKLLDEGWKLDANGYTTSFRVHGIKNGKTMEDLHRITEKAPPDLACSWNLGAADFYPATSGKLNAARHLMLKMGARAEDCSFMCDDDNDMELAAAIGRAFLPSVTSESVKSAITARPDHFTIAEATGTTASEEMLDAVSKHYGLEI